MPESESVVAAATPRICTGRGAVAPQTAKPLEKLTRRSCHQDPQRFSASRLPLSPAAGRVAAPGDSRRYDCTRCALHTGRHKIVLLICRLRGLCSWGEGPGADSDAQGLPFRSRAGQLLNNMIAAMGLKVKKSTRGNVRRVRQPHAGA